MKNKVCIIGGGTYQPIYNHVGLCSFAKGGTAQKLTRMFENTKLFPHLYLSKMASFGSSSKCPMFETHQDAFHTNSDLKNLIDRLKDDPETKVIILTAAVCDFYADGGSDERQRPDLTVSEDMSLRIVKADKIVQSIRDKDHKHIFLVTFKQTYGATPREMYMKGLKLCKESSANLVFVNDTKTRHNMIVTPEEASYADGWERDVALFELVQMTVARSHLSFTRSTVINGEPISWSSELVPRSLREIVDYCIGKKAYKAFNGSTVGHFACKVDDTTFLTSIRRSNFNDLEKVGLVKVTTDGPDSVTAYGAKPSVGGQSQRIIFNKHKEMDCIVHFHSPMKEDHPDPIETRSQREVECGSHECGQNTCDGLKTFGNLKAVYLHKHGPNIVFNRDIDPQEVIDFIERNFDLEKKTGGYNLEEVPKVVPNLNGIVPNLNGLNGYDRVEFEKSWSH